MFDKNSLNKVNIEIQKIIIKLLFEADDINKSQYNTLISNCDKKLQKFNKKTEIDLKPTILDITM